MKSPRRGVSVNDKRDTEFQFSEKPKFVQSLARLWAFADVYNTPQLRDDVMTALIEVCKINKKQTSPDDVITAAYEVYDALPSTKPICRFLINWLVVNLRYDEAVTRKYLEVGSTECLVDFLMQFDTYGDGSRRTYGRSLGYSCVFHEHGGVWAGLAGDNTLYDCWQLQLEDGAVYAGFLRACMSEVAPMKSDEATKTSTIPETEPPKTATNDRTMSGEN